MLGEAVRGRLAFTARDSDGQFRNLADGERLGEDERWAVRGLLEFDGGDTEAVVKAQTGRYRGDPTIRATEQDVQPLTGERLGGVYEGRFESQIFENVRATEISLRLTHHFDGFDLNTSRATSAASPICSSTTSTARRWAYSTSATARGAQTPFYGVQGVRNESDQFTQELRLSSTNRGAAAMDRRRVLHARAPGQHRLVPGRRRFRRVRLLGGALAVFVAADEFTQKIESTALFVHTTYQATEQLKFTLAGRISRDVRKLDQDFYNYDGDDVHRHPLRRPVRPGDARRRRPERGRPQDAEAELGSLERPAGRRLPGRCGQAGLRQHLARREERRPHPGLHRRGRDQRLIRRPCGPTSSARRPNGWTGGCG